MVAAEERIQELMNEGIAYMSAEQYEKGAETFREALELDKKSVELHTHLGNAYANLEQFDDAIKEFKTALMLRPEEGSLFFSIGLIHFIQYNMREAIRYFNKAEEVGFQSVELFTTKAAIFAGSKDYIQAVREISKAIEVEPLNGELYDKKIGLQIDAGLEEDVFETLEEYREILPDAGETYEISVRLYLRKKDFAKAKKIADQAIERFPADPRMYILKLQVETGTEQFAEAEQTADCILAMDIDEEIRKEAVFGKVEALAHQDKQKETKALLEEYTKDKDDAQGLYLLMNTCGLMGDFEAMKQTAERLREIPDELDLQASAMFCYAGALEKIGDTEAAEKEYRALIPKFRKMSIDHPRMPELYVYRVLCHTNVGEYEKALSLCDFLVNAYPDVAAGHQYKNFVYRQMGDMENADKEKEAALQIDSTLVF